MTTAQRSGRYSSETNNYNIKFISHNIFLSSYDKRKYRDEDEFDDRAMENNKFASIMMEEARSAKIGRREDLEDMRREEDEKKRKRRR